MLYNALPYKWRKTGVFYNRLLVEPFKVAEQIGENGLINPEHENTVCEMGTVMSCCEGSVFKEGDTIFYNKIDRQSEEHADTVFVDGKVLDVLYENEVWCRNERPVGRLFVEVLSGQEVTEDGLIIPDEVKSVTQKGRVFAAPDEYRIKEGDFVEFRKQDQGIFQELVIDGKPYTAIFEADVFKVNGECAPYRIIVKVDMVAQYYKRSQTSTGLALSPLFQFMLYNLQYAQVVAIGEEAKKMFPDVETGNDLIIHHTIEHQPYRVVGREFSKQTNDAGQHQLTYEYRAINCWDETAREIFAKINYEKKTGKILNITPFHGSVFLKWDFNLFDFKDEENKLMEGVHQDLQECHNLDDLKTILNKKKSAAAESAKLRVSAVKLSLAQIDPEMFPDIYRRLVGQLNQIQAEETKASQHLRKNHLVICKRAYPLSIPSYVITTFEELYPINIFGQKFLIAHNDFIIAQTSKNMNISLQDIQPLGEQAIILPIEEENASELLIPDTAKERPQKGEVVAIANHNEVKKGDIVLFRKGAGMEQEIDGVQHLIMTHDYLLAVIPQNK